MTAINPTTEADLQALISAKVQESLHLDYKHSQSLMQAKGLNELSKDVSAFANSDGGMIIFGITENSNHEPENLDGGLPPSTISKEQIETKIHSNTSPRIDGLRITPIALTNGNYAFAIEIPKSFRVHQDRVSHRFYKRFDFMSHPMENYEIEDARGRYQAFKPLVRAFVGLAHGFIFTFNIENPGDFVAKDVRISFTPALPWKGEIPPAIKNGIGYLNPGQIISFYLESTPTVLQEGSGYPRIFHIDVEYFHSLHERNVTESFPVDIGSLAGSTAPKTDLERLAESLNEGMKSIKSELEKIGQSVKTVERMTDPTGVALSQSTLRNLGNIKGDKDLDRYQTSFRHVSPYDLQEILQIDSQHAIKLYHYIHWPKSGESLETLFADEPEFVAKVKSRLDISD